MIQADVFSRTLLYRCISNIAHLAVYLRPLIPRRIPILNGMISQHNVQNAHNEHHTDNTHIQHKNRRPVNEKPGRLHDQFRGFMHQLFGSTIISRQTICCLLHLLLSLLRLYFVITDCQSFANQLRHKNPHPNKNFGK